MKYNHFYKIPMETLERIIDQAAMTGNPTIFNFVMDSFKNREQFHTIDIVPEFPTDEELKAIDLEMETKFEDEEDLFDELEPELEAIMNKGDR